VRDRLRQLLPFSADEGPRAVPFTVTLWLISAGVEVGRVGRDSYFLDAVGAGPIPYMYMLVAPLMIAAAIAYGRVIQQLPPHVILAGLCAGGAGGLVVLWSSLTFAGTATPWLPYVVFCTVETYLAFLLLHYWNFANLVFDAAEGKRLFPIFGAAGLLGSLVAGLSAKVIAAGLGATTLFLVWAAVLLLAIPLVSRMQSAAEANRIRPPGRRDRRSAGPPRVSLTSLRRLGQQPLARTVTYMTLPLWVVIYVIEYNYYDTMSRVFADRDRLAGFLGLVVGIGALVGFTLQLTLTPWCLRRRGVGATSVVYPLSLALGATALLVFSLFPQAARESLPIIGIALLMVFARLCDVAVFFSVYEAAQQLLYYAIRGELRNHARTLVSGCLVPVCMASAGVLLLGFRYLHEPIYNVAFVGVMLAFLIVAIALNVTPDYLRALLGSLDREDAAGRREVADELAKLEPSDASYALLEALGADDPEDTRFAVEVLLERRDPDLLADLEDVADRVNPSALARIVGSLSPEERREHRSLVERSSRPAPTAPGRGPRR
jgi:ATP/ADP translocase